MFCQIAAKKIPAEILYEDDLLVASLDLRPIREGHLQLIPRKHHAYFDDLPAETANRIMQLGQRFSKTLERVYPIERVAFLFTGGDIAHAHAHVVSMVEGTDTLRGAI